MFNIFFFGEFAHPSNIDPKQKMFSKWYIVIWIVKFASTHQDAIIWQVWLTILSINDSDLPPFISTWLPPFVGCQKTTLRYSLPLQIPHSKLFAITCTYVSNQNQIATYRKLRYFVVVKFIRQISHLDFPRFEQTRWKHNKQ